MKMLEIPNRRKKVIFTLMLGVTLAGFLVFYTTHSELRESDMQPKAKKTKSMIIKENPWNRNKVHATIDKVTESRKKEKLFENNNDSEDEISTTPAYNDTEANYDRVKAPPQSVELKEMLKERFIERRNRLETFCRKDSYKELRQLKGNMYITRFANSRLSWCRIPKIATTFLKRVNKENTDLLKQQGKKKFPPSKQKHFFLVREPYSRLVSAYLCKILTTPEFQKRYGKAIVSQFRSDPSSTSLKCGNDVSFPEFIKYFIKAEETHQRRNRHFMPIHQMCQVCSTRYDYVVHLETIKEDMTYIVQSANASIDFDVRDTPAEIRSKTVAMLSNNKGVEGCVFPCQEYKTLWWTFQVRGWIPSNKKFPLSQKECYIMSTEIRDKFIDLAINAYEEFTDRSKRSKQKKEMVASLYLQVPLVDRLKVKELLKKDCELFDFDSQPKNIFPEI